MNFARMLLSKCNNATKIEIYRKFSMARKFDLSLKDDVSTAFDNGLKHRKHPGVRRHPCVQLPYKLQLAAQSIINKYKGKKFRNDIEIIRREFLEVMVNESDEDSVMFSNSRKTNDNTKKDSTHKQNNTPNDCEDIRKKIYLKEPYNAYDCAAYMAARLPANYSAISYILNEIRYEEPQFEPSTLFDFGSGVGTSIWAADEYWKGLIQETFCVDLNENMNELSRELLQKGTAHRDQILDRVFYRQFLPVKHIPSYDLVVSAFSLLEFPDTRSRMYLVENLWKKTSGILVFVEHGSKAGFTAIMEARNFVLQISNKQLDPLKATDETSSKISSKLIKPEGSVLAPCPHDLICPRQSALANKSYCNFSVNYKVLDYGQESPGVKSEKFAYIVLKKDNLPIWKEEQKAWPRIVQPVIKKNGHTICRVCTNQGQLKEAILSKGKSESHLYRSARISKWGDKLPVDVKENN